MILAKMLVLFQLRKPLYMIPNFVNPFNSNNPYSQQTQGIIGWGIRLVNTPGYSHKRTNRKKKRA